MIMYSSSTAYTAKIGAYADIPQLIESTRHGLHYFIIFSATHQRMWMGN